METCEHGEPMDSACDECGRYEDGSDGTMAGDHRAMVKRWRDYLEREEEWRRQLWAEDETTR